MVVLYTTVIRAATDTAAATITSSMESSARGVASTAQSTSAIASGHQSRVLRERVYASFFVAYARVMLERPLR